MPRPDYLIGGEPARLIPITPDSTRELKSVSVIMAGLRSVLELRQSLLKSSLGVNFGTSAKLEAWKNCAIHLSYWSPISPTLPLKQWKLFTRWISPGS